ncbi:MAG: hypothetical protein HOV87_00440 [Catenulispora sp.]|nr:hypothetical protein [Catenulispora sp.]
MVKRSLRRRIAALCSVSAAVLATTVAASAPASADTRTMVLSFSCDTGLPYGLYINTGSGWYSPPGSSYADGTTKVYTISIPTSTISFSYQPTYCDNQPQGGGYPMWEGYNYGISGGTSTVHAIGRVADYNYSPGYGVTYLFYYCSLSSVTYG